MPGRIRASSRGSPVQRARDESAPRRRAHVVLNNGSGAYDAYGPPRPRRRGRRGRFNLRCVPALGPAAAPAAAAARRPDRHGPGAALGPAARDLPPRRAPEPLPPQEGLRVLRQLRHGGEPLHAEPRDALHGAPLPAHGRLRQRRVARRQGRDGGPPPAPRGLRDVLRGQVPPRRDLVFQVRARRDAQRPAALGRRPEPGLGPRAPRRGRGPESEEAPPLARRRLFRGAGALRVFGTVGVRRRPARLGARGPRGGPPDRGGGRGRARPRGPGVRAPLPRLQLRQPARYHVLRGRRRPGAHAAPAPVPGDDAVRARAGPQGLRGGRRKRRLRRRRQAGGGRRVRRRPAGALRQPLARAAAEPPRGPRGVVAQLRAHAPGRVEINHESRNRSVHSTLDAVGWQRASRAAAHREHTGSP